MKIAKLGLVALVASLSACRVAPPAAPFLTAEESAVVVVRPSQEMALRIAQWCEPIGAISAPTDSHLRQVAHQRGANVAEVLYDAGGSTGVLHSCPMGFDAHEGTSESYDAANHGTAMSATTQTVTIH